MNGERGVVVAPDLWHPEPGVDIEVLVGFNAGLFEFSSLGGGAVAVVVKV